MFTKIKQQGRVSTFIENRKVTEPGTTITATTVHTDDGCLLGFGTLFGRNPPATESDVRVNVPFLGLLGTTSTHLGSDVHQSLLALTTLRTLERDIFVGDVEILERIRADAQPVLRKTLLSEWLSRVRWFIPRRLHCNTSGIIGEQRGGNQEEGGGTTDEQHEGVEPTSVLHCGPQLPEVDRRTAHRNHGCSESSRTGAEACVLHFGLHRRRRRS
mmetsp:Transcript_10038/g.25050  ORF Transcript_10038/g.25050 Transcript_10038/m.25050 type:complete len:215 (+) Transcript_10038:717-1361(+)